MLVNRSRSELVIINCSEVSFNTIDQSSCLSHFERRQLKLDIAMRISKLFLATALIVSTSATAFADYSDPPKVEAGLKGDGKVPFH